MRELKHPFICISRNGIRSYGGSQMWSESAAMKRCGCGAIGASDVIIYLAKYHGNCSGAGLSEALLADVIPENDYDAFSRKLSLRYMPLIPPFGMNGLTLAAGMELFFLRHKMPYTARWGVPFGRLWDSIDEMLREDIPVILSIGPNFPRVWHKNRAAMYVSASDGRKICTASVKSHFLTVTGSDEEWLQVSSWGRRFYISRTEYEQYVKDNSIGILCNILYIKKNKY